MLGQPSIIIIQRRGICQGILGQEGQYVPCSYSCCYWRISHSHHSNSYTRCHCRDHCSGNNKKRSPHPKYATPRIKARKTDSEDIITLLPDSGATLHICCRASAEAWGLQIEELGPGEASLTDVQGGQIHLLGKATIALTLPSRKLETSVSLVVADTLGLEELIIGWMDLQRWGILKLEEGEVSSDEYNGIFAITPAAQKFLDTQTVYPPKKTFDEIDPCDPCYVEKMEVACSLLWEQLLKDVPLAFSDQLEPQNVVNFPPVRVSVREDMAPV